MNTAPDAPRRESNSERADCGDGRYRALFEKSLAAAYRSTPEGRILEVNEAFARTFGLQSREEALRLRAEEFYFDPRDREEVIAQLRRQRALSNYEARLRRRDGQPVWVLANEMLLPAEKGEPEVIQGTLINISRRKAMEESLRRERDFVSAVVDSAGLLVLVIDPEGRVVRLSRGGEECTGFTTREMAGRPYWEFLLPPEKKAQAEAFLAEVAAGRRPDRMELDCLTKSGPLRRIAWSLTYMPDAGGAMQFIVATGIDVTEHRRLEEQFRQSQKMEAIGQLAGGIAHDFNNLLTVITGHCDLLLQTEAADAEVKQGGRSPAERAAKIKAAADRAVALTRQLLTFSRAQMNSPRAVSLNEIIARSEEMLRPLLGEQVELEHALGEGLAAIQADPVQVEQVLMNLAINARDAMPQGGRITIETCNAELDEAYARVRPMAKPGSYVRLAVSDTGVGMDAATQARIFEPFFTTKAQGRGTGLGLATVYGIVKQSEGFIWVYSEVGRGTTFKIYWPRAERPEAAKARPTAAARRGEETILLVEDDHEIRALAREALAESGYRVLEAEGGERALALARESAEPIHLLLTDVVMPGISGNDLAERVRLVHGGLRVLYTSGYTDRALARHRVLDPSLAFVEKPFTSGALTQRVREVLDGRPRA